MKTKLIKIPLITFSILVIVGLYWYLNYHFIKPITTPRIEKTIEKTAETEKIKDKNIKSIELEKPPFIKD